MYAELVSREFLSPQLVRIVLGGAGLADYQPSEATDAYVNCFFLPEGAPYEVPFDDAQVRELPSSVRPRPRRMTVRAWDAARGELTMDIAIHGDVGYAGRFAASAPIGARLQMRGPAGDYRPDPEADWCLVVGDESALPAMAATVQAVRPGVPVLCIAVVQDEAGRIELTSPGDLQVHWLYRADLDDTAEALSELVARLPLPQGRASLFLHGEAGETRAVLWSLARRRDLSGDQLSCSPYWCRGMDDEAWRGIKGEHVRHTRAGADRIAAGTS